jgi:predicted permease
LPWQALVVFQIALSVVLLVSAGLLTRSLERLEHQEFGFQTEGRLIVSVDPALAGYTTQRLSDLYDRLYVELKRVPGVVSVSLSQYSPMGGNNWSGYISLEGRATNESHRYSSAWVRVGPRYFETIGTPLVRGRSIDERDTATALHVAVVNRTFAARLFPGEDAIGRHVGLGEEPGHDMDYQIVGVVEDAKYARAEEPAAPTFFIPLSQTVSYRAEGLISMQARSLFVRNIELQVAGDASRFASVQADIRRVLAAISLDLAASPIMTFDEQLARNFNQQRLVARLTSLYGQLALLLAAVGLYGVTSHQVARRTGEIGIRMALGANRRWVLGMVVGRAMLQTAVGLAIGLLAALVAGRGLASQLFGVPPYDPLVLGLAVAVLAASAALAAIIPAVRAARIEPVDALRVN